MKGHSSASHGEKEIVTRTYAFSLRVVKMCQTIGRNSIGNIFLKQVLRSGTSVGANVEEAQGGHSKKDFIAKIQIAYKEARETHYWLRLMRDSAIVPPEKMDEIIQECEQIAKVLASILFSTKQKN
jgi:four helix bundle protein